MIKKYEYLLFDADNTLFDFTKAERISFRETCGETGLNYSSQLCMKYSEINDSLWKKLETGDITLERLKLDRFRLLLLDIGYPDDEETFHTAELMRDNYVRFLGRQSCLIDGAETVCRTLSKKNKMYIVTNGISAIQRARLANSEIKDCFVDIFVSEEIGVSKPSRGYFDYVIKKIGDQDVSKYLVIGDSLTSDCDGAIAYGMDICRYNPMHKPSDGRKLTYDIEKLSELYAIL